jgi:hypothetical protein
MEREDLAENGMTLEYVDDGSVKQIESEADLAEISECGI